MIILTDCFVQLALVAVLGYLCVKYFLKRNGEIRKKNLQIKWNTVGKNVVVLHQFQRARFCPSPSPFVIKLETFLRLHSIKYVSDFEQPMSDKNKSPWITINGENITDSQLAIEYLTKKFQLDPHPGLTPCEKIVSRGLRFLIEQDLCWVLRHDRWVLKQGRHLPDYLAPVFPDLPRSVEGWLIANFFSGRIAKQVHAQGMGRHSYEEIQAMGLQDIQDLSDFLGSKDYMFGKDMPTEIDCVLFGFMCMFLHCTPKDNVYVQKIVRDCRNLVWHSQRMKEKLWPDWNECLFQDNLERYFFKWSTLNNFLLNLRK